QRQFGPSRLDHERACLERRIGVRAARAARQAERGRAAARAPRHSQSPATAHRCRRSVRSGTARAIHQGDLVSATETESMLSGPGSAVHELLRGWSGVALDYATVQAPMWLAMARRRAGLGAFLASPVAAGALMVATGIGMSLAGPLLRA